MVSDKNIEFRHRHIGLRSGQAKEMLRLLGCDGMDDLLKKAVPSNLKKVEVSSLSQMPPCSEVKALSELAAVASKNQCFKSWIGQGYANCLTPAPIQRNMLENPGWYTQYTPYQAEISQGRLEALLNFQTLISELTGLSIANASLLDEGTAAAEAMLLCHAVKNRKGDKKFFVSEECLHQTQEILLGRAKYLGIDLVVGDHQTLDPKGFFGVLVQYPTREGKVYDYRSLIEAVKAHAGLVVMACDLLSLVLLKSPGELGADIAVGNAQRFGIPLGCGGPHPGFFATVESLKRRIPGRIVGVSKDRAGRRAFRLALQTREQHIRREKATSNICTAQALLANMAGMFAVYHGPEGLKEIAESVHKKAQILAAGVEKLGYSTAGGAFFDTILIFGDECADSLVERAESQGVNFWKVSSGCISVALDETTTREDIWKIFEILNSSSPVSFKEDDLTLSSPLPSVLRRSTEFLRQEVFHAYRSETELMRYMKRLENQDLSLTSAMIPLGSCTMKLNAASELFPLTWKEFSSIHPFAPADQRRGYKEIGDQLEAMLAKVTGFDAVSLQPNSGAQGEYTGLLVIRAYHEARGDFGRRVCLIPVSAHGTNPASAVLAGMEVVVVSCDALGNVDLCDLQSKLDKYSGQIGAAMVTYPSTHGVFEEGIIQFCHLVHEAGGQVYLDGANLNALVGVVHPADFGADVCHINLHKTFCIPHGGGGPGAGPVAVRKHLAPYLPGHKVTGVDHGASIGAVSSAPLGNAGVLPISWMYMRMMGGEGLRCATQAAILSANYIAKRLGEHYDILFRGKNDLVAHECIVDLRPFKKLSGVEAHDVAKRLIDYGFHAPTVSFPVVGTFMIEPTESESKEELDRFCDAMIAIRSEIQEIIEGKLDRQNNLLKNAPHSAESLVGAWDFPYSRERAAFPLSWIRERKFWPPRSRIEEAYGDRNLCTVCS